MATIGHGSRTMKRFAKYLLAGVIIQVSIILVVVLAGVLLPSRPEGPTNPVWEYIYIASIFSSPGLMLFAPYASERNPHPPFSDLGLVLGIIFNILFYSAIVYLTASLWRTVGARLGKLT
jgi:hypothetical protein